MYSQSTSVHRASEAFPMMRYIIDVLLTYLFTILFSYTSVRFYCCCSQKSTMADRINVCFLILVGLIMLNGLTAYPTGAPEEACINMTPNHLGYEPSLYPPPFTVTVSSPKFTVGEPVSG